MLVVLILAVGSGSFVFRIVSCNAWRDDYSGFIYSETLKNTPMLYGPDEIEAIIGEEPAACERPDRLTNDDIRRFGAEGIGPNYFDQQIRATSAARSSNL